MPKAKRPIKKTPKPKEDVFPAPPVEQIEGQTDLPSEEVAENTEETFVENGIIYRHDSETGEVIDTGKKATPGQKGYKPPPRTALPTNYIDIAGRYHIYVGDGQYVGKRINAEGNESSSPFFYSDLKDLLCKVLKEMTREKVKEKLYEGNMSIKEAVKISRSIADELNSLFTP